MKEEDRLKIISQINKDLKEKDKLKEKQRQLEEMRKNPQIKQYLRLQSEIVRIKKHREQFSKNRGEIETDFHNYIHTHSTPCLHDIWIYEGSFSRIHYPRTGYIEDRLVKDENDVDFTLNIYTCLECGQKICTAFWTDFEKTHYVLKDYSLKKTTEFYTKKYYNLLYTCTVDEAQQQIIGMFDKSKVKTKKLTK